MPNYKKTGVWKHFSEIRDGTKIIGKCLYCGQTYANNATRMKKHLTNCVKCPEKIRCLFHEVGKSSGASASYVSGTVSSAVGAAENIDVDEPVETDIENTAIASPSGSLETRSELSSSTRISRQSSLSSYFDKMSTEEKQKLDESFARAIYSSGVALSITENPYLKEHYKQLRPSYELPSRYRLSNPLLNKEYDRIQVKVAQKLAEADSLTLMSDGWTDIRGNPLINIIFVTPQPVFVKAVETTSRHTGEYIAKILSTEIESVGASKVQAVVTDNASNMKLAWKLLKDKYPHLVTFGCLAHGLNLLAKDINNIESIKNVIGICKTIINFFSNHHVANQTLKKIQKEKDGKESVLSLPIETRWGSTARCLDSLLKSQSSLQSTAVEKEVSKLLPSDLRLKILDNDGFWRSVQEAHGILQPISEAIRRLEGDKPNLSEVYDILRNLVSQIKSKFPFSQLSSEEQEGVTNILQKRVAFCSHPIQLAANLLDPRSRGQFLTEEEVLDALDIIVDIAQRIPDVNEIAVTVDIAEYRNKEKLWSRDVIWRAAVSVSDLSVSPDPESSDSDIDFVC